MQNYINGWILEFLILDLANVSIPGVSVISGWFDSEGR